MRYPTDQMNTANAQSPAVKNPKRPLGRLHTDRRVTTRDGVKYPFTLSRPLKPGTIASRIHDTMPLEMTDSVKVVIKMVTATFGYATIIHA